MGGRTTKPASAILLTEEEEADDTIIPRFLATGGNAEKFSLVKAGGGARVFRIEEDLRELECRICEEMPDTELVIFDPLVDFTKAQQNVDAEVREMLNKLKAWAAHMNLAVVGISHLNKKTDLGAIHRVSGARAWVSVARSNFLVGRGPDGKTRHVVPLKNNLSAIEGRLDFAITTGSVPGAVGVIIGGQPVVSWRGKGTATLQDLTAPRQGDKSNEVDAWLLTKLDPSYEWKKASDILEEGNEMHGYSEDRIYRARKRLKAEYRKSKTTPSMPSGD